MATTSPNLGLKIWNLLTDPYDHAQLADNWAKVDEHDHSSGKGKQIPTGGIADGAVTAAKIDPSALPTLALDDASVTTAKLNDGAVTTPKIGTGQVTSGNLADGTIQTADIGAAQVTTALLKDDAVTSAKLQDDAGTDANRAVTTDHIRDGAVTSNKVGSTLAGYLGISTSSSVRRGYTSNSGNQTTTSTSYVALTSADEVQSVVVPTNGLLIVRFSALWKLAGATNDGKATIFIGANQLVDWTADGAPTVVEATLPATGDNYGILTTSSTGFTVISSPTSDSSSVTTGTIARRLEIDVAPGTYTVQVRYHVNATAGGTLNVKERVLRVDTEGY